MKPNIDQTSALKRDEDPDVLAFREAMNGYKPVRCSPCGKQLAWVKGTVNPGMKMKAEDALTLEGEKILPHTRLPMCSNCGGSQIGVSIA